MRKVAIIGNGDISTSAEHLHAHFDYRIAADGGANYCATQGVQLDYIVGDGDSITEKAKSFFSHTPQIYNVDQHTTDLAKAIAHAHTLDQSLHITLFGFTSSARLDHTEAAIHALTTNPAIDCIITPSQTLYVVRSSLTIHNPTPRPLTVSLLPVANSATVHIEGMQWSGSDIIINAQGSGMSNTITDQQATVTATQGSVLMYVTYEENISR